MPLTPGSAFKGTVYCSSVTRRLLMMKFSSLFSDAIVALELNVPHAISIEQANARITFTLVDANHCPGAVVLHARCVSICRARTLHVRRRCNQTPPSFPPTVYHGDPFCSAETAGSTTPCAGKTTTSKTFTLRTCSQQTQQAKS
jgi:hypothetical protein